MSGLARRLQRVKVSDDSVVPPSNITHGEQLRSPLQTGTNTSPAVLLGANWQSQLTMPPNPPVSDGFYRVSAPGWGQWPASGFPNGTYVYNNNPSNHGGYVPAGGMLIDGYFVPEGVYVVQFMNLAGGFYFSDAQYGFLLRGCRFRPNGSTAPGIFNVNDAIYGGRFIGAHYCDIGGIGPQDANRFEVGFKIDGSGSNGTHVRLLGNYISYHNTAIQFPGTTVRSFEVIENFCEKPNYNYGAAGPKGDGDDIHLNGIWISGGQTHCLILRNKIVMQHPDELGRPVQQTDCMIMFQRTGQNLGTGQNADGTPGYQIRDNYMGGGGWTIYAGRQDGNGPATAQNFTYTGNKITTQWWPNGGSYGPIADQPVWGQYGNVQSNNTWADGVKVGQSFV